MKIAKPTDFVTGVLFVLIGLAVWIGSMSYKMGSVTRMGPGFIPSWLGVLLILVGLALGFSAFRGERGTPVSFTAAQLRSMTVVTLSVVLFAICLSYLGLVVAIIVLVVSSSFALRRINLRELGLTLIVLLPMCWGLFVYWLNLQVQFWPVALWQ